MSKSPKDQSLHSAWKSKGTIIFTVFSEYELRTIKGTVLMFEASLRMVKIILEAPFAEEDECVWIAMRDILKAEVKEIEVWNDGDVDGKIP